jgi:HEAT repeat protein
MIEGLLRDSDPDMRALALQQIRSEVPGEAATKRFAGLLPGLKPEAQGELIDALDERGDKTALPAVIKMLKSKQDGVRAVALQALGSLGGAAEVPVLARKAAAGSEAERAAARQSLRRLKGDDVQGALVSCLTKEDTEVQVELLGILADRGATPTVPDILQCARAESAPVRLAALEALKLLADEQQTAELVSLVKAAGDTRERRKASAALMEVCGRGKSACAGAIVAGIGDAEPKARLVLLRSLAEAGGGAALKAVVAELQTEEKSVRDEAVRVLSSWQDASAVPHLMAVAGKEGNLLYHVLAIRGLVRLASAAEGKDADLQTLGKVVAIARRPDEKRLILGALGGGKNVEALELVVALMDSEGLTEEAALAAVALAEKLDKKAAKSVRAAMQKVLEKSKDEAARARAEEILKAL